MARGADWAKDYLSNHKKKAMLATKKLRCSRKGKKFKMVKISDNPPTWKEIEVKD